MKRKAERQKAANEYCESEAVPTENLQMAYIDFTNGDSIYKETIEL